jgi:hypothetical protein
VIVNPGLLGVKSIEHAAVLSLEPALASEHCPPAENVPEGDTVHVTVPEGTLGLALVSVTEAVHR